MVFCALAITCAGGPTVRAGRFTSSKDRAQGDVLYQQAFAAYQAADYAQALSLIEKADLLKPDQPDGWNLRGMAYLKQNAFDKAETAFSRAVSLDPKLWAAQFNLAETPFQGKDYARARARFERLVDQTDRYKEPKEWELVQYKVFMSCLLMGDNAGAAKKLTKLPTSGGVTPAYLYAQASLAFSHKDAAGARKSLAAAQGAFSPLLNDLFSNSLVEAGWQSPLPPPVLAANTSLMAPPATGPMSADSHTPIVIDPALEASAAEPLPLPDAGVRPVMAKLNPTPVHVTAKNVANSPAPPLPPPRHRRRSPITAGCCWNRNRAKKKTGGVMRRRPRRSKDRMVGSPPPVSDRYFPVLAQAGLLPGVRRMPEICALSPN